MTQQGHPGLPRRQGMGLMAPRVRGTIDHELGQGIMIIKSLLGPAHKVPINRILEREVEVLAETDQQQGQCQENCLIYNTQAMAMKETNNN